MKVIRTPMLRKTAAAKLPAAKAVRIGKRLVRHIDQTARDEEALRARGYKPATAEDVDDLALLPKRFDMFAAGVQQQLEVIGKQILPLLTEIRDEVKDLRSRVGELEKHRHASDDRFAAHHHRIAVLETHVLVTKRKPRKRK